MQFPVFLQSGMCRCLCIFMICVMPGSHVSDEVSPLSDWVAATPVEVPIFVKMSRCGSASETFPKS